MLLEPASITPMPTLSVPEKFMESSQLFLITMLGPI